MKNNAGRLFQRMALKAGAWRVERWIVVAVGISFAMALAVVLLSTQLAGFRFSLRPTDWEAGKVADTDFVVDRDSPFVDEKATELKREARKKIVPPVYRLNDDVNAECLQRFDAVSAALVRLAVGRGPEDKVFLRIQADYPGLLDRSDVSTLLTYPYPERALADTRRPLEDMLATGIIDLSAHREEILNADGIELIKTRNGREQAEEIPLDNLDTVQNISHGMQATLAESIRSEFERRIVLRLLQAFAVENAFYDPDTTLARRNQAAARAEPVMEKLVKGQVLVRRGDIISEPVAAKIRALSQYSITVNLNGVVGSVIFLIVVFAASLFLLSPVSFGTVLRRPQILLVLGMGLGYLLLAALSMRLFSVPVWIPASVVVPTSTIVILVTLLVSTPVGISFSVVVSLAVLLLTGMNIHAFLFALVSGLAGTAVVSDADKRIDLIRAGLLLALVDSVLLAGMGFLGNYDPGRILSVMAWGVANGFFCGILALGFLPIFEHLLNAPTRFRLMELSDLNAPVFKRMLSLAPGTYTHSLGVANLAESACEAIGANALLARVSAYYHDVGKIDQADYFIENQKSFNKHDEMKASLSAAVIKSHVRIGVEKAKELNLPQAIVDNIAQHHGRGLITYFYHRAVNEEKDQRVSRDLYSYPGIRPRTREAAVLMLADAVEAASRSFKKPTAVRLETLVREIVLEKFNSGELGDSSLTLRDLETIRKSFLRILEGVFHTRIEYPTLKQIREAMGKEGRNGGGEAPATLRPPGKPRRPGR